MVEQKICIGYVSGAHALRGGVKIRLFLEDSDRIKDVASVFQESGEPVEIFDIKIRDSSNIIARIGGVDSREKAEAVTGTKLFVDKDTLFAPIADDSWEFYPHQLKGLSLFLSCGNKYGEVAGVYDFGAGSVIEVKTELGAMEMIPFSSEFFQCISISENKATVIIPDFVDSE